MVVLGAHRLKASKGEQIDSRGEISLDKSKIEDSANEKTIVSLRIFFQKNSMLFIVSGAQLASDFFYPAGDVLRARLIIQPFADCKDLSSSSFSLPI